MSGLVLHVDLVVVGVKSARRGWWAICSVRFVEGLAEFLREIQRAGMPVICVDSEGREHVVQIADVKVVKEKN